jgi:hypothetical protein
MWHGHPLDFAQGVPGRVFMGWKSVPQTQNQPYLYHKNSSAVNEKKAYTELVQALYLLESLLQLHNLICQINQT